MKWLIGLAAGAAAVYLLNTEKGKTLIQDLQKQAGSAGENFFTLAGELLKKGSSLVGQTADKAKSAV